MSFTHFRCRVDAVAELLPIAFTFIYTEYAKEHTNSFLPDPLARSGPRCSDLRLRLRCSHAHLHDCSAGCVVSVVDGFRMDSTHPSERRPSVLLWWICTADLESLPSLESLTLRASLACSVGELSPK